MAWFEGSHSETFTVARDLPTTRAAFADPGTIAAHTEGLRSLAVAQALSALANNSNPQWGLGMFDPPDSM